MSNYRFTVNGWYRLQKIFGVYEPDDSNEFTEARWKRMQKSFSAVKWVKEKPKRSLNRVRTSSALGYRKYDGRDDWQV